MLPRLTGGLTAGAGSPACVVGRRPARRTGSRLRGARVDALSLGERPAAVPARRRDRQPGRRLLPGARRRDRRQPAAQLLLRPADPHASRSPSRRTSSRWSCSSHRRRSCRASSTSPRGAAPRRPGRTPRPRRCRRWPAACCAASRRCPPLLRTGAETFAVHERDPAAPRQRRAGERRRDAAELGRADCAAPGRAWRASATTRACGPRTATPRCRSART